MNIDLFDENEYNKYIENDLQLLALLKNYFNDDSIIKTIYKYDFYHFKSPKYNIIFVDRKNLKIDKYKFSIVDFNKLLMFDKSKKTLILFLYNDNEYYYIDYNMDIYNLKDYYNKEMVYKKNDSLFINNRLLIRINNNNNY